jgi:hypothetical protein
MCVIMLASNTRPTEDMVKRGWDSNKDGAGIAWREKNQVVWEKGIMEIDRVKELCASVPLPYVVHFRVASIGGVKPSLTHPFTVGPDVDLALKGRTEGAVLFHNGHWGDWHSKALDAAIHSNSRVPEGSDWSDSRAMAWLIHIYGPGIMELLHSQKGVLMYPKKFNIFTGNGWDKINDVWCSNDYFWAGRRPVHNNYQSYGRLCSVGKCTERVHGGKDVCHKCEAAQKAAAETIAKEGDTKSTSSVGQSAVAIVTGGSSGPLVKMFSMPEVENFYKGSMISKSTLKKYRKAHGGSHQTGNKGQRALTQMRELSEEIAERLMNTAGSPN